VVEAPKAVLAVRVDQAAVEQEMAEQETELPEL
jgi:hypothetical protein